MRHRLWFKLLTGYIIAIVSMFAILNTYGTSKIEERLLNEKKISLYNEASSLSTKYMQSYYNNETSFSEITYQLNALDKILGTRIWIVNASGYIISDTRAEQRASAFNISEFDPNFLNHTFSENTVILGLLSEPHLSVVVPVVNNYKTRGYIVLHSPLSEIYRETTFFADTINISLIIFALILAFAFVYLYCITVVPLRKLMHATTEYADGNYEYKINFKRNDEFQDLANSLTYMSSEISNLDEYQKMFVANMSHDFRSPLTSIKGYATALQDGTIPYEMKDKYLDTILFETERLEKLTTSLLELNNLTSRQTLLHITSFDINKIIKKTAESFEGIGREKKITIKLSFFSSETFVDADQGKIQQIIYNLLDNAIKFSPDNSDIYISTLEKGDKAIISVKDHGTGIPKDSLGKIWERFYKTDPSRGKDKTGTGLGLSIVKEVITAHDENINVISTEGVGSEFIFTLQRTEGFL